MFDGTFSPLGWTGEKVGLDLIVIAWVGDVWVITAGWRAKLMDIRFNQQTYNLPTTTWTIAARSQAYNCINQLLIV